MLHICVLYRYCLRILAHPCTSLHILKKKRYLKGSTPCRSCGLTKRIRSICLAISAPRCSLARFSASTVGLRPQNILMPTFLHCFVVHILLNMPNFVVFCTILIDFASRWKVEEKKMKEKKRDHLSWHYYFWRTNQSYCYLKKKSEDNNGKLVDRMVTFHRRCLSREQCDHFEPRNIDNIGIGLPLVEFVVHDEGSIEDDGGAMLQADFANEYIGGGVIFFFFFMTKANKKETIAKCRTVQKKNTHTIILLALIFLLTTTRCLFVLLVELWIKKNMLGVEHGLCSRGNPFSHQSRMSGIIAAVWSDEISWEHRHHWFRSISIIIFLIFIYIYKYLRRHFVKVAMTASAISLWTRKMNFCLLHRCRAILELYRLRSYFPLGYWS